MRPCLRSGRQEAGSCAQRQEATNQWVHEQAVRRVLACAAADRRENAQRQESTQQWGHEQAVQRALASAMGLLGGDEACCAASSAGQSHVADLKSKHHALRVRGTSQMHHAAARPQLPPVFSFATSSLCTPSRQLSTTTLRQGERHSLLSAWHATACC